MNLIFNKKILIPAVAAIFMILIIAGLFIKLSLLEKRHLLIDYLPGETEFWFWQNKNGFREKTAAVLGQLGVDDTIVKVLQNQKDEIVIYRQDSRWYKIEPQALDKARMSIRRDDVWERLHKGDEHIIGFLRQDYISDQLGELSFIFKPCSYYFILKQEPNVLLFSLLGKEEVFKVKLLVKEPPVLPLPSNVILAIKSKDAQLLNNISETLKDNIREYIAFDYPVVISTQLPDDTWMKEKVIKPELLKWQETSVNVHQLVLDKSVVDKYKIADQLTDIEISLGYYQDEQGLVFGLHTADLSNIILHESIGFFYLNLTDNDTISVVDILGKSQALSWLQSIGIKSIIVYEDEGIMEGELRF